MLWNPQNNYSEEGLKKIAVMGEKYASPVQTQTRRE
jgi:hypothetical protein